jgi:hypothetical protein
VRDQFLICGGISVSVYTGIFALYELLRAYMATSDSAQFRDVTLSQTEGSIADMFLPADYNRPVGRAFRAQIVLSGPGPCAGSFTVRSARPNLGNAASHTQPSQLPPLCSVANALAPSLWPAQTAQDLEACWRYILHYSCQRASPAHRLGQWQGPHNLALRSSIPQR